MIHNRLKQVILDVNENGQLTDITFYLHDPLDHGEPFGISEFLPPTKDKLEALRDTIAAALKAYAFAQLR